MFTGLIQAIGTVQSVKQLNGQDARYQIDAPVLDIQNIEIGASIACSGCCLTVVEKHENGFAVDVSGETLSKTILGQWQQGTAINIEPSLKLGDELGGHLVSGHVDGMATITDIREENGSHRLTVECPEDFAAFIAPKGSVALDGISLTVNEVEGNIFGVNIISHTWQVTTFGGRKRGDQLNLEIDTIARYVARIMQFKVNS